MIIFENRDQNRDAWLEMRKTTVGSSEIPTIMGLNKFETPLQLYLKKRGEAPPTETTEPMEIGTALEPVIGRMFARRMGEDGIRVEPNTSLYRHDTISFATASPDFDLFKGEETGILETKYSHYARHADWENGQAPVYATMQLMWQLGVTKRPWGYIAGFVGEFYKSDKIEFKDWMFARMVEKAEEFLWCVRNGKEPKAQADDMELVSSVEQRTADRVSATVNTPEAKEALKLFLEAKEQVGKLKPDFDAAEKAVDTAKAQLLQALGPKITKAEITLDDKVVVVSATPINCGERIVKPYSFIRMSAKTL